MAKPKQLFVLDYYSPWDLIHQIDTSFALKFEFSITSNNEIYYISVLGDFGNYMYKEIICMEITKNKVQQISKIKCQEICNSIQEYIDFKRD